MLLLPTTLEPADGPPPARSTPVVWTWLALVLALFVCERLVVIDHDLGLGLLPRGLFAVVTFTTASWSLYGEPELFALWQVWSHLVVHPSWWRLALEVVCMLVVGRALERVLGPALFLALLACLGPLGGVALVLLGGPLVYTGGLALVIGLTGVAVGRLPAAQVRWDLVWWLIVAVGQWPLFRLPLHTLLILLLVVTLAATPAVHALPTLLTSVAVAGIGVGLGTLMRRRLVQPAG